MKALIRGVLEFGIDGVLVDVECHISNGLPAIVIVGVVSKAVDESKERIRSAFANSSINFPKKRITINIAPADIPKDSTSLDLALATSIMLAGGLISATPENSVFIGELGLDGSVRGVRGIIGKILTSKKLGIRTFIVPFNNIDQASLVPDTIIIPIKNLYDLYLYLSGKLQINPIKSQFKIKPSENHNINDFAYIVEQQTAKRGIEIAASGGHNILLNGPPGTGKSMLAKALISILPALNKDEILEVTHIHSLISHNYEKIVMNRPFRSPHHTASNTAIIGGGNNPKPGEISLSHRGVLFFDEFPEFTRPALEALRQPLEDKTITISRAKDTLTFPADFMLVATANPCPCGYYNTHKNCTCTHQQLSNYQRKLSGPIIDRIDIFTDVENIEHTKLLKQDSLSEKSLDIAKRVLKARNIQNNRLGNTRLNNSMTSQDIKNFAHLDSQSTELLNQAASKLELSPRIYMRIIKVARTIADLDNSKNICSNHIAEALQYRPKNNILS